MRPSRQKRFDTIRQISQCECRLHRTFVKVGIFFHQHILEEEFSMFMRRIPTQEQRYILADLLRHGREAQDLTQQQISDLLDCSLHWVNDMEQGKCDPSWRDAFHYAAIIKLDPIVFAEEAGLRVSIPSFRK
ncbi:MULTISPECIES: helix-turn-helix domain-containing protein [unclassified Oscillibacter]